MSRTCKGCVSYTRGFPDPSHRTTVGFPQHMKYSFLQTPSFHILGYSIVMYNQQDLSQKLSSRYITTTLESQKFCDHPLRLLDCTSEQQKEFSSLCCGNSIIMRRKHYDRLRQYRFSIDIIKIGFKNELHLNLRIMLLKSLTLIVLCRSFVSLCCSWCFKYWAVQLRISSLLF